MSLTSSMDSAVSGLLAQSKALSSISSNIANSSTTAYKSTSTSFESFLYGKTSTSAATGGVVATTSRSISSQGDIASTSVDTNLAISGEGFFVVSTGTSGNSLVYTRDGSFSEDSAGYLTNEDGYYLYGWALDDNGDIAASNSGATSSLTAINIANIKGDPKATSTATITGNLPADLTSGEFDSNGDFTTSSDLEIYDGQGNASEVTVNWSTTSSDTNTWVVSFGDSTNGNAIYSSSDSSASTGTTDGTTYTVAFDSSGKLSSITNNSTGETVDTSGETGTATLSVTWSDGTTQDISVDLGTIGSTDGLTSYASGEDSPDVSVTSTQNGYTAGTLTGVTIDSSGYVTASFDNGQTKKLYEIPVATFTNEDGLTSLSGTVFAASSASGSVQLSAAGSGSAGSIESSALESSSVDLTDQFSLMITTQQAYSAAAKVMTTTNDMMTTLINIKS